MLECSANIAKARHSAGKAGTPRVSSSRHHLRAKNGFSRCPWGNGWGNPLRPSGAFYIGHRIHTLAGVEHGLDTLAMPYTLIIRLIDALDPDLDVPSLRPRKAQGRLLPQDRRKRGTSVEAQPSGKVLEVRRKGKVRDQGGAG